MKLLKLSHAESEGAGGGKCTFIRFMGQLWTQPTAGGRCSLSHNSVPDRPFNHDGLLYIHKEEEVPTIKNEDVWVNKVHFIRKTQL